MVSLSRKKNLLQPIRRDLPLLAFSTVVTAQSHYHGGADGDPEALVDICRPTCDLGFEGNIESKMLPALETIRAQMARCGARRSSVTAACADDSR
jgi:hypothetical protein